MIPDPELVFKLPRSFTVLFQISQGVVQMDSVFLEKGVHLHRRREPQHLPYLSFGKSLGTVPFERKRFDNGAR
jgi:hypothetical protein